MYVDNINVPQRLTCAGMGSSLFSATPLYLQLTQLPCVGCTDHVAVLGMTFVAARAGGHRYGALLRLLLAGISERLNVTPDALAYSRAWLKITG